MYIPKLHESFDPGLALKLIQENAFATLISDAVAVDAAVPGISHLPLLVEADDQGLTLTGHFARANGHWQAGADRPVVVIFNGPHGYISPRWYSSPNMVPTWN